MIVFSLISRIFSGGVSDMVTPEVQNKTHIINLSERIEERMRVYSSAMCALYHHIAERQLPDALVVSATHCYLYLSVSYMHHSIAAYESPKCNSSIHVYLQILKRKQRQRKVECKFYEDNLCRVQMALLNSSLSK